MDGFEHGGRCGERRRCTMNADLVFVSCNKLKLLILLPVIYCMWMC